MSAKPKTNADYKRAERERVRSRGFVLRQVWVHPEDWARVRAYVDRVKTAREQETAK